MFFIICLIKITIASQAFRIKQTLLGVFFIFAAKIHQLFHHRSFRRTLCGSPQVWGRGARDRPVGRGRGCSVRVAVVLAAAGEVAAVALSASGYYLAYEPLHARQTHT